MQNCLHFYEKDEPWRLPSTRSVGRLYTHRLRLYRLGWRKIPVLITHVWMMRSPLRTTQDIPVTLWLLPVQQSWAYLAMSRLKTLSDLHICPLHIYYHTLNDCKLFSVKTNGREEESITIWHQNLRCFYPMKHFFFKWIIMILKIQNI